MTLPPGQRSAKGFPRFGGHLHRPPPPIPAEPAIELVGDIAEPCALRVADLGAMPRRTVDADFHCVAGWSATGLRWEGVAFETLFRSATPTGTITHVVFVGLDGWRSVVALEDALAADVLVADRLDGEPLGGDHGAPARLVSPSQYGFISTKHLCRIEFHTAEPPEEIPTNPLARLVFELIRSHPRARVAEEERHRYLPARALRPVFRALVPPIRALSARGGRDQP